MPIYEYHCKECDNVFEEFQKGFEERSVKCPKCEGEAERLISNTSFVLKGTGWYVTDYNGKSNGTSAPGSNGSNGSKDSSKDSSKNGSQSTSSSSSTASSTSDAGATGSSAKSSSASTQ